MRNINRTDSLTFIFKPYHLIYRTIRVKHLSFKKQASRKQVLKHLLPGLWLLAKSAKGRSFMISKCFKIYNYFTFSILVRVI